VYREEAMLVPVCVFAKPPLPGKAKTRLVALLGTEGAASLAAAMLSDVWDAVANCPGVRPVLAATEPGPFPIPDAEIWLQGDGDLGDRIEAMIRRALQISSAAIAVGADTPALTHVHIRSALDALSTADAVMGRCCDGGFYLLALKDCPAGLLSDLPWSTPQTAQAVLERLKQYGMSVSEIEPLFDIDCKDDLVRLSDLFCREPSIAAATRRVLQGLASTSARCFQP
jgi:rSAM/selenodomain-associated transferase 1